MDGAGGLRDRALVDEEIGERCGGLGRQEQQWRSALGGLGQAGQGVGQPRSLMDRTHAKPAGGARVRIGHGHRAGFVPRRDESHPARGHRIGQMEIAAADQTEEIAAAELGYGAADRFGDAHRSVSARRVRARALGFPIRARWGAAPR